MKIIRDIALSLISFLLFLSLTIFGLAFMVNGTVLNPEFVSAEINRLDVSQFVEEFIQEETDGDDAFSDLSAAIVSTIDDLEPVVKEGLGGTIDSVYDYLLGNTENLDLALILKDNVLNPEFIGSLLDEMDFSSLFTTILLEEFGDEIPIDMEEITAQLEKVLVSAKPEFKAELVANVDVFADYLLGESRSLSIEFSLEPVKVSLKDSLKEAYLESPPSELASLSRSQLEVYFDELYRQFSGQFPSTFTIDESLIGDEVPAEIAMWINEAEEGLQEARKFVGYFQLGYKVLIALIFVLVLDFVLLTRDVKRITRGLGITLLTYGVIEYIGIFAGKYLIERQIKLPGITPSIDAWYPQFVDNLMSPLATFSLAVLIVGVILVVISFLYKRRES